jgi:hypothetical protein
VGRGVPDALEDLCGQLTDQLKTSRPALQTDVVKGSHLIIYVLHVLENGRFTSFSK